MYKLRFLIILITLGIFLSSCTKEDIAPELPPQGSFVLEIDDIWKDQVPEPAAMSPGMPESMKALSALLGAFFVYAAASIFWWNTVLTAHLFIPSAAFLESFNHEAVWDRPSGTWNWTYDVDLPLATFSANLRAETSGDIVKWSMFISKSGGYTDFLWFTGESNVNNSSGWWTINKNPEGIKEDEFGIPYIDIEWNINTDGTSDITYTNIEPESAENGNYITYGIVNDTDLDAYYDIYRKWEENEVNIKWNKELLYGRVLSMNHFQDPYWHCWNQLFKNIACE